MSYQVGRERWSCWVARESHHKIRGALLPLSSHPFLSTLTMVKEGVRKSSRTSNATEKRKAAGKPMLLLSVPIVVPLTLGARAPGNGSEHLRNIEGRGTIYLAHSHQEHFMPILNVT